MFGSSDDSARDPLGMANWGAGEQLGDDGMGDDGFDGEYGGRGRDDFADYGYSHEHHFEHDDSTARAWLSSAVSRDGHRRSDADSDDHAPTRDENRISVSDLRRPRGPHPFAQDVEAATDQLTELRDRLSIDQPDADKPTSDIPLSIGDKLKSGFVDKDGNRRRYDAPAPPTEIDWLRIADRLRTWVADFTAKRPPIPEDVDGKEPFILLSPDGKPEDDFAGSDDAIAAIREAEEILRPIAVTPDLDGFPRCWSLALERALRDRGIKLSDSIVISVAKEAAPVMPPPLPGPPVAAGPAQTVSQERIHFGMRYFHLNFRYFFVVILHGKFADTELTEFDVSDKRFVGYYYVSMSADQAVLERCT